MLDFNRPGSIFVTCLRGAAPALEQELAALGKSADQLLDTGVWLRGSLHDCMRLNLHLRSASQVMYSLKRFRCQGPDQLYQAIKEIAWEEILPSDGHFTVHGNVYHSTIQSGMFANVRVKDAIVDRMRQRTGKRPDSGAALVGAVVYLFWRGDHAELFLDTSGETLAKHGYRRLPGKAPMVEALAAATVLSTRWDQKTPLVNPMCGSGTIAIEAAMIATRRVPGLLREQYAFCHLIGFDRQQYRTMRAELVDQIEPSTGCKIIAGDIDAQAVKIARQNADQAGVAELIEFEVCDFFQSQLPASPGVILVNPEYGERLGDTTQLADVYRQIGDFFKQKAGGYWGYVFTGNLQLAKHIGLKTKRRMEFSTAQLDCRLLEYELYAGSRKAQPAEPTDPLTEKTERS